MKKGERRKPTTNRIHGHHQPGVKEPTNLYVNADTATWERQEETLKQDQGT